MELIKPEFGLILWSFFAIGLLYFWISTLVSIGKSDFIDHRTKMVWGLLVFFLPLIGVLLYYSIGRNQRINHR